MIKEINNFLRHQKGSFASLQSFQSSGLYSLYEKAFGPLIYTEEKTHNFIGVDKEFNFYDEIYYPQDDFQRKGTVIPKIFFELGLETRKPDPVWSQVSKKGFAILPNVSISKSLFESALGESFLPYGMNKDLDMAKTILHPYFASQANYDVPELHQNPVYMSKMTDEILKQIPTLPLVMEKYILHTADIIKYVYDESDANSKVGPYRFHMDFVPRNMFMFFVYFSTVQPILGRELLIGQRKDFDRFSSETLNQQKENIVPDSFRSLEDEDVSHHEVIQVENNSVILMNTLNPMFVHRVNKLPASK